MNINHEAAVLTTVSKQGRRHNLGFRWKNGVCEKNGAAVGVTALTRRLTALELPFYGMRELKAWSLPQH